MNCLIGISLTLVAIVAGMLLLAKTQKDNLGNVYKAVSYFVIIVAFLSFLCGVGCGLCRVAHCAKGGGPQMENCSMMDGGMGCGMEMMGCRMMRGGGMGMGMGPRDRCCKKMMKMKNSCRWEDDDEDEDEDEEMEDVKIEITKKEAENTPEEPAKK